MRAKIILLIVVFLSAPGCALLKKGYRVCVGYLGAEVCLDKPAAGTTNQPAVPKP